MLFQDLHQEDKPQEQPRTVKYSLYRSISTKMVYLIKRLYPSNLSRRKLPSRTSPKYSKMLPSGSITLRALSTSKKISTTSKMDQFSMYPKERSSIPTAALQSMSCSNYWEKEASEKYIWLNTNKLKKNSP